MTQQLSRIRAPRRDARRNRERILAVAREAFNERGLDVPVSTIARLAGFGTATVYRHFPTRHELVVAAFTEQMHSCAALITTATELPDPWEGFRAAVTGICRLQRNDRAFTVAFLNAYPDELDLRSEQTEAFSAFADLVRRAKKAKRLRPDFSSTDLISLLITHNALLGSFPGDTIAASERFLAITLSSWSTAPELQLPPAPTIERVLWMGA
jgi:AcrR family transcriptional regulator